MNKTRRWWRKALSLKLLKNQIILWFVTVIVLLLAVVAGFTLFTLRPYLYDTRVRQLQKNVDLLSWELDNQREKLQDYSVNIHGGFDNTVLSSGTSGGYFRPVQSASAVDDALHGI